MKNIRFVFVSKDENFLMDDKYLESIKEQVKKDFCISYKYVENNKQSLAKIYNSEIDNSDKLDYLSFFHADVKLDLVDYLKSLIIVDGLFDVIGLAGCSKFKYCACDRLNWFTASRESPDSRYGHIITGELQNYESFFNKNYDNVPYKEVACIDGLSITINRKCLDSKIRFDERYNFGHYDTDFSLNALLNYNLKIGVIVKETYHYSLGVSILSDEFAEEEKLFREKWDKIFKK